MQASSIDDLTIGSDVDWSGVTNFIYTFSNMGTLSLTFPSNFDWSSGTSFQYFLNATTLSSADYNALLIDIESSNQNNNVVFDAPNCTATGAGLTARTALVNDHSWTISDNS